MKTFGGLFLIVGLVLALVNFGVWEGQTIGSVFRTYWPAILVYFSVVGLIGEMIRRSILGVFWNIVMLCIGGFWLFDNLGYLGNASWSNLLIPGALIVFGFLLLFSRSGKKPVKTSIRYADQPVEGVYEAVVPLQPIQTDNVIKTTAGELKLGGPNWKLESTRIQQRAGSIRLDLRETFIPEGETVLDIDCKAGDVNIFLPDGLEVLVESRVKLGNNRVMNQQAPNGTSVYKTPGYDEAERKVRLHILVKFGDIHVSRVG
ncbi:cell wall-active antibiotics response protein [Tumebacillus sp. ITR2]|uniref:Cell wall-active antibiotics response protein n=1 Tax=Tumebacillus amylolyticus TaxID=2801339 RepID=A0ABS1JGF7_9BACL|nr:cell wall-active antibiotics response protein LiaF [Tumebacillus amylolyticus]MBL0389310.1 cell wall-active antibiotics response protein [Tumebacillus amylolyticus]